MPPKEDNVDSIHLETTHNPEQDVSPAPKTTTHNDASPPSPTGRDKAAQFLKQAGHQITVTPSENARVLRKIDLRLLPLLLSVYCLQSLDKTTLSYASVFGIIEDTGLQGDQFSWLGSVVYVAQLAFQPVIAYGLVRVPIGKFSSGMVFCWGAVLCGMAAAQNFGGLMATRLLLGTFEASVGMFVPRTIQTQLWRCGPFGLMLTFVAPTFIAVVQMWYRRREQTIRNACWYSMLGVVNMVRENPIVVLE